MNHGTIKVDGSAVCWVNRLWNKKYEVHFPPEETLKSLYFTDISEVHDWLDRAYGCGSWVVE